MATEAVNTRDAIWSRLQANPACDVLILGGGVNGAGLLRDLALQQVALRVGGQGRLRRGRQLEILAR